MNAKTFLDNFGTIASAPGGLERLRELILDRAVHGGLVPQQGNETPASIELGRLDEYPEWRVAARERSAKRDPKIEALAGVARIPEGWAECRMEDIVQLLNGRAYGRNELLDDGTPVIRIQNLNGGDSWYYSDLNLPEDKMCDAGDLLFAWSASFGPYIWTGPRAIFHYHIWRIHLSPAISRDYLYYVLQHLTAQVRAQSHGLAMLHMTKARMERWPILLPPVAEQGRIVAKVDELMRLCEELDGHQQARRHISTRLSASFLDAIVSAETHDDLHAAWSRLNTNWEALSDRPDGVDPIRRAIVQLAVRGRLVPQDPAEEDASRLIERIAATQRTLAATSRGNSSGPREEPPAPRRPPIATPPGWAWTRLGNLLSYCRNGISTPNNDDGRGFPLLRISAGTSRSDWLVDLQDCKFADLPDEKAAPYLLDPGDLLACRFNGNLKYVGMVSQVPQTLSLPVLHPDKLIRMKAIEVRHEYLRIALNSDVVRSQIEGVASTTAGNIGINGAQLQNLLVPVPPLAEQDRIVAKFFELLGAVELLLRRLEARESVWAALAASAGSSLAA